MTDYLWFAVLMGMLWCLAIFAVSALSILLLLWWDRHKSAVQDVLFLLALLGVAIVWHIQDRWRKRRLGRRPEDWG